MVIAFTGRVEETGEWSQRVGQKGQGRWRKEGQAEGKFTLVEGGSDKGPEEGRSLRRGSDASPSTPGTTVR
eukprot:483840-Rhodomonas_salina.1